MLISLVALAVPVAIIVLFVQIGGLKQRLRLLEGALANSSPAPALAPQIPSPPPLPPSATEAASAAAMVAAVSPWEQRTVPAPPVDTDQDRPFVMRADRFAALAGWLRDNWIYAVSAASLGLAGIFFVQYGMERGLWRRWCLVRA